MRTVNAKEAQNNFGDLMNKAIKGPVIINKYGKPSAVLISYEDYENFTKFEDLYWEMQANEARKGGFLSREASEEVLNKIMKGE